MLDCPESKKEDTLGTTNYVRPLTDPWGGIQRREKVLLRVLSAKGAEESQPQLKGSFEGAGGGRDGPIQERIRQGVGKENRVEPGKKMVQQGDNRRENSLQETN